MRSVEDGVDVRLSRGEVSERFMVAVLKTAVAQVTGGSNPSLSVLHVTKLYHNDPAYRLAGEVPEWSNGAAC